MEQKTKPLDEMQQPTNDALEALWIAANNHSVCMLGEFLDGDFEGDDMPPAPSPAGIVRAVIKYLEQTV